MNVPDKEWMIMQDKAELCERIMPFIDHIALCEVCHKSGTDRCEWVIAQWTNTCDPDDYDKRRAQKLIDGAEN